MLTCVEAFDLEGRLALVTGGNGGLGLAMALGLRDAGARVAVTGRDPGKNRQAQNALGQDGVVLQGDVTDEDDVAAMVEQAVSALGGLHVLVNNAGAFRGGRITEMSLSSWRAVLDSHLTGAFLCARSAVPHLTDSGAGKIINIGSMYSSFGAPDFADYTAAKSGLLGLTRALAVELAPRNIQVNAVLPGWFETDLTRGMPMTPLGEQIRRRTPAARWGMPTDLVGPIVFLASHASDFVTGAALPVDGGYLISDREAQG